MSGLGPITTVVELDEVEEAIILKMFRYMNERMVPAGILLGCDQQAYNDLWGRMK